MDAAEHDRLLAWTSHLPQSAATALAVALAGAGIPPAALGPGGRDATRLAGSSPELWTAVAADNADFLAEALDALEARLAELRACLAAGDVEATARFFGAGRAWFEQGPA
jgi:prephenate dehydrogenase